MDVPACPRDQQLDAHDVDPHGVLVSTERELEQGSIYIIIMSSSLYREKKIMHTQN